MFNIFILRSYLIGPAFLILNIFFFLEESMINLGLFTLLWMCFYEKKERWQSSIKFLSVNMFILILVYLKIDNFVVNNKFKFFGIQGIEDNLYLDKLNLSFLILNNLIFIICSLFGKVYYKKNEKNFYLYLIFIHLSLTLTFLSSNIILFYIFFEFTLIPMFLMMNLMGSRVEKKKASYYLFMYTFISSMFFLISLLFIFNQVGSLNFDTLNNISLSNQNIIGFFFVIGFLCKLPLFPFHIWLPQAHVEAPLPGSIILAGILLKVGGYGIMKFFIPNFPNFISSYNHVFMCLSLIGIVYASLIAIKQTDFKRLIAYSSISHMGFVMLGLFSLSIRGIEGSFCLMIAHGLSSSSLFILVTILYQRFGSRTIKNYCGLIAGMPLFSNIFIIVTMISTSFPSTLNFCGEILILIGLMSSKLGIIFIALISIGIVLGSVYSFLLYNSLINGRINKISIGVRDLNRTEFFCLISLIIPNIWLGLFPFILINDNFANIAKILIFS